MSTITKKRGVVSFENMSEELAAALQRNTLRDTMIIFQIL